jgi:DNA invertase Pin-like site-specific DNA recombinase
LVLFLKEKYQGSDPMSGENPTTSKAVAYMRTSSATNAGTDKDSEKRQRAAIQAYASRNGIEIVDWFYDTAVSGADPIAARPGFSSLLARIAGNGIRTILVETANRFARDLMVQEVGYRLLQGLGVQLVATDSPDAFPDDTPTSKMIRQILGVIAEFDKDMTVAKLKGARDRKRASGVKVEGRKSHAELQPEVVALAKKLRGEGKTLREIAARLEARGHVNARGKRFNHKSIKSMTKE